MGFGSFDGSKDEEHNGVGLKEYVIKTYHSRFSPVPDDQDMLP